MVVSLALFALGWIAHAQPAHAQMAHAQPAQLQGGYEHAVVYPTPNQPAEAEQPSIEAREGLPAADLREGEQVRVVATSVASTVRPPDAGHSLLAQCVAPARHLGAASHRWCDVVQCRRLSGALLLRFATPPPAHG